MCRVCVLEKRRVGRVRLEGVTVLVCVSVCVMNLMTPPNSKLNIALVEVFEYYVAILQGEWDGGP